MSRIKNLIIIAGPAGCGKSFLLKGINSGRCPKICDQLGIQDPAAWHHTKANHLPRITHSVERLVVHYDCWGQYSHENGFAHLQELIPRAEHTTVLTLYVPSKILAQRIITRLTQTVWLLISRPWTHKKRMRNFCKLKMMYTQFSAVLPVTSLYKKWFEFIDDCSVENHWLLDLSNSDLVQDDPYDPEAVKALIESEESAARN